MTKSFVNSEVFLLPKYSLQAKDRWKCLWDCIINSQTIIQREFIIWKVRLNKSNFYSIKPFLNELNSKKFHEATVYDELVNWKIFRYFQIWINDALMCYWRIGKFLADKYNSRHFEALFYWRGAKGTGKRKCMLYPALRSFSAWKSCRLGWEVSKR